MAFEFFRQKARSRVVLALTFAQSLALAGAPRAAGADDVDALIREGVQLRRKGDDAAALKRFRDAYQINKTPRAAAQMGLAEQALGAWVAADRHLQEAIDAAGDAWVVKNRSQLTGALAHVGAHLGTLEISGAPAGAEVRIDGQPAGTLPAKVRVPAGTVVIEVRAPGYVSVRRPTAVEAGGATREIVTLQTEAVVGIESGSEGVATVATGGASSFATSGARENVRRPVDPPGGAATAESSGQASESTSSWRGPVMIGTVAGAGLALGWGVAEVLVASSKSSSFNDRSECNRNAADRGSATCADLYDSGRRATTLSYVAFGLAGALAITSLTLYLTRPSLTADHALLGCTPVGTGARDMGVSCALRF